MKYDGTIHCEGCTCLKGPSIRVRLSRVNEGLRLLGLRYHDTMSGCMSEISNILEDNGFSLPEEGQVLNYALHTEVGEGKWLSVTFHKMESGRYEVVAYVN